MRTLLIATFALFACAAVSPAQSCRSRSYGGYSSYSYSAPAYSYQSYAAPSYGYAAPAVTKTYKEETKYLKFLAVLPLVELPSYSAVYSPPQQLQSPQAQAAPRAASSQMDQILSQQQAVLTKLDQLDKNVQALSSRVEGLERSGRFGGAQPQANLKTAPDAEPIPKQPSKEGKLTAALVNKQACAVCHERGNEQHGGDFVMSEPDGKFTRWSDKQLMAMERLLLSDKMPKINKRSQEAGITGALNKEAKEALLAERDRQVALPPEEKKELKQ